MSKSSKGECVKVVVRCRPMNEKEVAGGYERCIDVDTSRGLIECKNTKSPGEAPKSFTFDSVYDWNSKQVDLYEETFRDLVESVLEGFNGTIFAYGQTGTGKTFTMQGEKNDAEGRGVIPNSFAHIFQHISRSENQQYLVRASYLEIYQEEIRDLLSKDQSKRLDLKERPDTGVYVKDLSSFVTKSIKEIEHVMNVGNQNRSVGRTNMNEHSSRSHAIFITTIECSEVGADNEAHIRVGKLNLVDLAGSERQAKTGAVGERLKEATKINLSLSALGNVISALVDGKSTHVPYRDAKLTRLLQDSLGGNAKTVMVANIGPASYNYDESLTTLRYANRAKNIKNKPKINEDPKDALLREFQEEIARLKSQLSGKPPGVGGRGKKKGKRRRQRRDKNGELVDDSDDSGSGEDDVAGEADYMAEQQRKLDEEKSAIMNDQSLIAEDKEKLISATREKEMRLKKEREAQEQLNAKIKAMESKLLCGGRNIVDHTNDQQKALEIRRKEIAEQKRKEREIEQTLVQKDDMMMEMHGTYQSLQHEVEVKTKKLKKLFHKLQESKREIEDLHEEHARERQELDQTLHELTREVKLRALIIENFIPPSDKNKIMNRARYDEDEDTWMLESLSKDQTQTMAKRPQSAVGNRRPISEFAKAMTMKHMNNNYRYLGENILLVELDMPSRTTRDYEGPTVAPRVQAALDAALRDEEDIEVTADGSPALFSSKAAKIKTKRKEKPAPQKPRNELFPQSRGLVRK